jgi:hypothetical protein
LKDDAQESQKERAGNGAGGLDRVAALDGAISKVSSTILFVDGHHLPGVALASGLSAGGWSSDRDRGGLSALPGGGDRKNGEGGDDGKTSEHFDLWLGVVERSLLGA